MLQNRSKEREMWKQDLKIIGILTAGLGAVGAAILNSRQFEIKSSKSQMFFRVLLCLFREEKGEEKETAVDRTGDLSESAQDKVEDVKVASSNIIDVVKETVAELKGKQDEKMEELGSDKGEEEKEEEEKVPGEEKGIDAADSD